MARILVVDDERDVVLLIKFMLEKDGHAVLSAHDGAEALARMGIEPRDETVPPPDLAILDVMMPVLDGWAVCTRMREDPRTAAVPVIVLTAKGEMKDLFNSATSVAAHLEKPFDPKALRELVAGMTGGR
ncbi:MAG: response regulator [Elusimicrobiota bacterium]|nr:response regulator [Elusimicrobiota bacterium]